MNSLANEYAKIMCDDLTQYDYSEDGPSREDYLYDFRSEFLRVIKFLNKSYYIIEKDKMKELY